MERRHSQHGGRLERHVRVVLIVASLHYRSIIIAAAADSRARSMRAQAREDSRAVRPHVAPSGSGATEAQRAPPRQAHPSRRSEERLAPVRQPFDGSDCPDSDSLQRCWS
jgi:hypothetical protein